jgi:hypothetical protein
MSSNPVKVTSLREEMDRNGEARIAAVIAEFGGGYTGPPINKGGVR